MSEKRKIPVVAICCCITGDEETNYETVYALREDGAIFWYSWDSGGKQWRRLPPVPDDDEVEKA